MFKGFRATLIALVLLCVSFNSYAQNDGGAKVASAVLLNFGGITVNGLGDSELGGQAFYAPNDTYSTVPTRQPSTTYIANNLVKDGGYMYRVTVGGTTASVAQGPSTSVSLGTLTGGSGYTAPATYPGVTLTGGTCTVSPIATIVVLGGAVTTVTFTNRGLGCSVNDNLTTAAANIGGGGTGFNYQVTYLGNSNGASSITDGTATMVFFQPQVIKTNDSVLYWMEVWSNGKIRYNMEEGYQGPVSSTVKGFVLTGGSGYSPNDTWASTTAGASGGLIVNSAGAITGVTVTQPGYGQVLHTYTINTSTGSGATLSFVVSPSGTFAVNGAGSLDMVQYAKDAAASHTDMLVVWSPTNDDTNITTYAQANTQFALSVINLQQVYNTILASGKKMIIVPPTARASITIYQETFLTRIRNWELSFYQKLAWTNPNYYNNTAFADPTRYAMDLTQTGATAGQPIGGTAAGNGAMTYDGLHPSVRGAQYIALELIDAASKWIGTNASYANIVRRTADPSDWEDDLNNPGGNMFEAQPWVASETLAINQARCNGGNLYYTYGSGTTAASGGPTGTGGGITDGTAHWNYSRPCYDSVMLGTSTALSSPPTGITYVGNYVLGYTLARKSGSASGTVTGTVENPYSDGMIGQRQKFAFSLGTGTDNEVWTLTLPGGMKHYNYQTADFDITPVQICAEVEVTSAALLNEVWLALIDTTTNTVLGAGENPQLLSGPGTHLTEMASTGEMIARPVKELICSGPMPWPVLVYSPIPTLYFGFDASGAAGSATATIAIDSWSLRHVNGG